MGLDRSEARRAAAEVPDGEVDAGCLRLISDVAMSIAVADPNDCAEVMRSGDRLSGELVRLILDTKRRHLPHQRTRVDHLK